MVWVTFRIEVMWSIFLLFLLSFGPKQKYLSELYFRVNLILNKNNLYACMPLFVLCSRVNLDEFHLDGKLIC